MPSHPLVSWYTAIPSRADIEVHPPKNDTAMGKPSPEVVSGPDTVVAQFDPAEVTLDPDILELTGAVCAVLAMCASKTLEPVRRFDWHEEVHVAASGILDPCYSEIDGATVQSNVVWGWTVTRVCVRIANSVLEAGWLKRIGVEARIGLGGWRHDCSGR